jgi:hypothetical protein
VVIWLAHSRIDRSWRPTSIPTQCARIEARQRLVLVAHGKGPAGARPEGNAGPAAADSRNSFSPSMPRRERKAPIQLKYDPLFEHVVVPASGKKGVADARDTADPWWHR